LKIIRAAVVGAGFIGKQHIEAIRRIPGTIVAAVADNGADIEGIRQETGIDRVYKDYGEMFQREEIDVVHNCTPNYMHQEINLKALEYGIAVYSEKPLALNVAEAQEVCCKAAGIRNAVNFNYRHNIMVQEMKGRMLQNELGRITYLQAEYLQDWLLYENDFDWRMEPQYGGNSRAIADIGSHCFDMLQYILGERIVFVYASLDTVYPRRQKGEKKDTFSVSAGMEKTTEVEISTEDNARILFRMESGIEGSILLSQVCAGKKNGLHILIGGNKKSMEWRQEEPDKLWIGYKDKGNEVIYASRQYLTEYAQASAILPNGHPAGWTDTLRDAINSFYQDVRGGCLEGGIRYADFEDGLYIVKLVEACLASNKTGCWVHVK